MAICPEQQQNKISFRRKRAIQNRQALTGSRQKRSKISVLEPGLRSFSRQPAPLKSTAGPHSIIPIQRTHQEQMILGRTGWGYCASSVEVRRGGSSFGFQGENGCASVSTKKAPPKFRSISKRMCPLLHRTLKVSPVEAFEEIR